MTNDDAGMASFASGDYTGRPSAHLVFISIAPGFAISRLYMLTRAVPWYLVCLYAYAVISLSAMTQSWRRHRRSQSAAVQATLAIAIATLASVMFVLPTFTVAAMAATVAASVMLADIAATPSSGWTPLIVAVTLLGASAALRFDSFLGGLAITSPLLLLCLTRLGYRRCIVLGIAALTIVVGLTASTRMTENAEWRAYREFNEIRGTMHGTQQLMTTTLNADSPAVQSVLADNAWSSVDLRLFGRWFIEDPAVYNATTLRRLQSVVDDVATDNSWSAAWSEVVTRNRPLISLVCASAVAVGLGGRRRLLYGLGALAWTAAICGWVARAERFPLRIAIPLLTGAAIAAGFAPLLIRGSDWTRTDSTHNFVNCCYALAVLGLVVAPLWIYSPSNLSSDNAAGLDAAHLGMTAIRAVDTRGTFIILGASGDVFDRPSTQTPGVFSRMDIITTGWNSQSPHQRLRLAHLGLSADLISSSMDRAHVWFVARRSDMKSLVQLANERYHFVAAAVVGATLDGGAVVFRLQSK